jgi:hypothetical protein
MKIREIFDRDISRSINGVVKADQMDDALVWQELEEFVVTKELSGHLSDFYNAYLRTVDAQHDPAVSGKIGVWVSGFFGSGKSHMIKVLSHLLENRAVTRNSQTRRALEFLGDSDIDRMLLGDMERAAAVPTDAILFNIDNKADSKSGRDAVLSVFLKVLNERLGYSGDHAHIANMEYQLDQEGKLQTFHNAYALASGSTWDTDRDAYQFHTGEIAGALAAATGQTQQSQEAWLDTAEEGFELSVEHLCRRVKAHLGSQAPNHRVLFLADEVGQFIGDDTHLMLNLQTIAEGLGSECGGRAWIIVTSQEDIDQVLGDTSQARSYDFSKIQGRFPTRLSLSSTNADEVIQKRLLTKTDTAAAQLSEVYEGKRDILANQMTFRSAPPQFTGYANDREFVESYPFAPYQFRLVQRVFEEIRKVGATGRHLAQGERSMLDAFQSALLTISDGEVGKLIPLYRLYPAIEGFLDSNIKRTISHAQERFEDFDVDVLRLLFLIRYVDEMPENVDNLVTLCADAIDVDSIALRGRVEAALKRLEDETLIGRSGDRYHFLTDEEQDIGRRIKETRLDPGVDSRFVGRLIYDDILKLTRKHHTAKTQRDIGIHKMCDGHVHGTGAENGLHALIVTPLSLDYDAYNDSKCQLDSIEKLIIRVDAGEAFDRFQAELTACLQTEKYVKGRDLVGADDSAKRVIQSRLQDNSARRKQLATMAEELVLEARFYVHGQGFSPTMSTADKAVQEALDYLVENSFSKMGYLETLHDNPKLDVQALLRSDDLQTDLIQGSTSTANQRALEDLRQHLSVAGAVNQKVTVYSLVEEKYGQRPYAWPEWETLLLLAHLSVVREIEFVKGGVLTHGQIYSEIEQTNSRRAVTVQKRQAPPEHDLREARHVGRDLFGAMGIEEEDPLAQLLREGLQDWRNTLSAFRSLAETGDYPGITEIDSALNLTKPLASDTDSGRLISAVASARDDLMDAHDDIRELREFYQGGGQKAVWERLRDALHEFSPNRSQLVADAEAATAIAEIDCILAAPAPYGMLANADTLIQTVKAVNDALVKAARDDAKALIDQRIAYVAEQAGDLTTHAMYPTIAEYVGGLEGLVLKETSLGSIHLLSQQVAGKTSEAIEALDRLRPRPPQQPAPAVKRTRMVRVVDLAPPLIESTEEADAFIEKLRGRITDAIANNERVQIS